MNQAKISVIVPVYNGAAFVADTMAMLGASTLREIEIIAINDGSKDNSLAVLKECAAKDGRIKVIDKENGGIANARNRGLQEASGQYICFCDHDDYVEPNMYERLYAAAEAGRFDVVVCGNGRLTEPNTSPDWVCKDVDAFGEDVMNECFLPAVFNKSTLYMGQHGILPSDTIWKCMVKRSLVAENELSFHKFAASEDDWLFEIDIFGAAKSVRFISDILYYWRVNLKSESHRPPYVEDLYTKNLQIQDYIASSMERFNASPEQISDFKAYYSALRYSREVENEVNHEGASLRQKKSIIKEIYSEDAFKRNIKMCSHFKKSMIIRKIECTLLRLHLISLALLARRAYGFARMRMHAKSTWSKVENKLGA